MQAREHARLKHPSNLIHPSRGVYTYCCTCPAVHCIPCRVIRRMLRITLDDHSFLLSVTPEQLPKTVTLISSLPPTDTTLGLQGVKSKNYRLGKIKPKTEVCTLVCIPWYRYHCALL